MSADRYSAGEVAYLLSLPREEAINDDISQPDSCSRLSPDGNTSSTAHTEPDPVMTIARWSEVWRARQRLVARAMRNSGASAEELDLEREILERRAGGETERGIADDIGVDRMKVRRVWKASMASLLDELGGEAAPDPERKSAVPACLSCAMRPRERLQAVRRKVRGGHKELRPERLASLCAECYPLENIDRLVPSRAVLARIAIEQLAADVNQNAA